MLLSKTTSLDRAVLSSLSSLGMGVPEARACLMACFFSYRAFSRSSIDFLNRYSLLSLASLLNMVQVMCEFLVINFWSRTKMIGPFL